MAKYTNLMMMKDVNGKLGVFDPQEVVAAMVEQGITLYGIPINQIQPRLEALAKENEGLREKVKRLDGPIPPAAPQTTPKKQKPQKDGIKSEKLS